MKVRISASSIFESICKRFKRALKSFSVKLTAKSGKFFLPVLRPEVELALRRPNFDGGLFASIWDFVAKLDDTEVIDDQEGKLNLFSKNFG